MTRIVYDRQTLRLDMEGHAGAGEKGTDPVCAALSMLGMTLERRTREMAEHFLPTVTRSPGRLSIACQPESDWEERCRECFDTVAAGLELLAEEKADFVCFWQDDGKSEEENAQ